MSRIPTALRLVLIGYVLIAIAYSVTTPIFEASDELWHFATVKTIADTHDLPVQNPAAPGDWRQEGGQPPLYYMLGAALTFWIDTSDFHPVRQLNPHADNGLISPDGNANIIVHDSSREAFPWRGTVLAVHLLRLFSIALGFVTVLATYGLARTLFPDFPLIIPIGASVLVAFNPMFLFISGSVNNDNLSNALASVLLLQIVRLVRRPEPPRVRTLIYIGIVGGAGLLAKLNIGFLLPLVALALVWNAWQRRTIRPLIVGGAVAGGLTIVIAGWWYLRNWQLYGDPTGLNVFLQIVGSRAIPADVRELWSERHTFLMSFWGFFGAVNIPLPDWIYTVFNAIAALGLGGTIEWLLGSLNTPNPRSAKRASRPGFYAKQTQKIVRPADKMALMIARAFSLFWIAVLFISLLRWTSVTAASQGRLMFAAIAPLGVWIAFGLWKLGSGLPIIRARLVGISVTYFIGIALFSLTVIAARYTLPAAAAAQPLPSSSVAIFCEPASTNGPAPCLKVALDNAASRPQTNTAVTPGNYYNAVLWIQPQNAPFTHTWSLFVHLVDPTNGRILAQRDVYPGEGLLDTLKIMPNAAAWLNPIAVRLPDYTDVSDLKGTPELRIGFYDYATSQRMTLIGSTPADQNEWTASSVLLVPRPPTVLSVPPIPNAMNVSFANQMMLVGYRVSRLSVAPGQKLTVTLYWQCPHKLTTDYHVFVHLIDPQTTTIFGQDDAMPDAWKRPTTTWLAGEVVADSHTFTVKIDAQRDTWPIEIGVYQLDSSGNITRLRVFNSDGSDQANLIYLTPIRIIAPIPDESF